MVSTVDCFPELSEGYLNMKKNLVIEWLNNTHVIIELSLKKKHVIIALSYMYTCSKILWLSVSHRSIMFQPSASANTVIGLLANDKSQYFAKPCPAFCIKIQLQYSINNGLSIRQLGIS